MSGRFDKPLAPNLGLKFKIPCQRPRRGAHHEHQRFDPNVSVEGGSAGNGGARQTFKGFEFTVSPSSDGPCGERKTSVLPAM